MIELTGRQRACLRTLCVRKGFSTVESLARMFDVSSRTMRTDLKAIESFALENGCSIERVPGKGVRLSASKTSGLRLRGMLDEGENRVYGRQERDAVAELLLALRPVVKFQDISDYCHVSKQTIASHFSDVDDFYGENGVEVIREPGVGSHLAGAEIDIRRCFLGLVSDVEFYNVLRPILIDELLAVYGDKAATLINAVQEARQVVFADQERLTIVISFVLMRISRSCMLSAGETDEEFEIDSQDDPGIGRLLSEHDDLLPTEPEIVFVASILLSQRLSGTHRVVDEEHMGNDEASSISRELVCALRELHEIDEPSLQHVLEGFTRHLRAAIYRSRNGIQIQAEVPVQITSSIPLLYDFTRKHLAAVEARYGISLNDSEVAYIAMYLDAIYETSVRDAVALNVLFACSFGLASSSILMTRLSHALADCHVVGPMSLEEARGYISSHNVDLVITTNHFDCEGTPVLEVDPLLNQEALDAVKRQITTASYSKLCSSFLRSYSAKSADGETSSVREVVDPFAVQVGVECSDWREAIRKAANPLLRAGYIEQHYVDRMVSAVEDYGPYMVLTPGMAYVHAGVNDGIRDNCAAILVLRRTVAFGPAGEKRVRGIVVLGIRDKERSDLLSLASIFECDSNLRMLENPELDVESVLGMHD